MSSTKKLFGLSAAASVLALSAAAQDPVSLTIVSWGGAYTASQQRAYHDPFMEMNPHVTINNDDGSANALAGLRAQSQAGNVTWDLVDMLPSDAQLACDEGIIMQIDHDEMLAAAPDGTPASEDFLPGSLGECFIPQIVYSTVLTYRPGAFEDDAQPTSIADLFDVENFPGRRALQDRPGTNMEWALYADGVDPEDIYDVLRTPEGVDRALQSSTPSRSTSSSGPKARRPRNCWLTAKLPLPPAITAGCSKPSKWKAWTRTSSGMVRLWNGMAGSCPQMVRMPTW